MSSPSTRPAWSTTTPAVAPGATAPVFFLRNGFPANFLNPADLNLQTAHVRAANPNMPNAMTLQWSFGIQRELPGSLFAEVNYVGTHTTHLQEWFDYNMPINGVLPNPNFGYVEYTNAIACGHYDGLEASLLRRFKNELQFRLAYTWSRSIDDAPEELVGNDAYAQNGYGPQWTGPSDFDTPQRIASSYVYDLPAGRGHRLFSHSIASYILGNWRTSGVYTFSSGLPFTVWSGGAVTTSLDPNGASDPVNTAVPNVIGKAHIVGNVNCWFFASQNPVCDALAPNLTNAFQLRASGQFGNSARNSLRGPRTNVFDFDLMKDFIITEAKNLQFRWEMFNLFNTPIFGPPSADFSNSAAGSNHNARGRCVMQLALRFSF
jgi:hypothetical protein